MGGMGYRFEPLYDKLLVRPDSAEEVRNGIIIPDTAKDRPRTGKVLEVGQGRRHPETGEFTALMVKPGDVVMFGKYAGADMELNGEQLLLMREDELFGLVHIPVVQAAKAEPAA